MAFAESDVNNDDNVLDIGTTLTWMSPESIRDVTGAQCAWRESGDGPTVVLLHGLGGSRVSWEPQLVGLSDRFRVVAWDLPGYGESPPLAEPLTFVDLADAVIALVDELHPDQPSSPVHLAGISFGGMIAQYVAARHPRRVSSLSLLATSSRFGLDGTRPDEWRAARLAPLQAGREPADFAVDVLRAIAGPTIGEQTLAGQVAAMSRISSSALARSIECLVTHNTQALLASINAPTQVLVGELDTETPVSYAVDLAERIPAAQLHVIAGVGHLLNVEAPSTVNDLLAAHVTAHLSERETRP
jgi:3-oxoadipate enol-lactonase